MGGFCIWEKQPAPGGTWHDNHYPGCACDIPSHLYSFSFYPKADWSRRYAPQAEIEAYLHDCIRHFGIGQHIEYQHEVKSAVWQHDIQRWRVEDTQGEVMLARFLISATGQLNIPVMPKINGIEHFSGPIFHSARWDVGYDLRDKNIAVIGTNDKYGVATIYGPFVHWQAAADWLDKNPSIRDGYKWVFIPASPDVYSGPCVDECNNPYLEAVMELAPIIAAMDEVRHV